MSELHGTWYDGRSSRGQPARLASPSPGKLRIVAGDMVREFDAGEARLSPRLGRLARQLRLADGGPFALWPWVGAALGLLLTLLGGWGLARLFFTAGLSRGA